MQERRDREWLLSNRRRFQKIRLKRISTGCAPTGHFNHQPPYRILYKIYHNSFISAGLSKGVAGAVGFGDAAIVGSLTDQRLDVAEKAVDQIRQAAEDLTGNVATNH